MLTLPVFNEDKETCSKCRGKCCKNSPGGTMPAQWAENPEGAPSEYRIRAAVESGDWIVVLQSWDGGCFVRPNIVGGEKPSSMEVYQIVTRGPCRFLGATGCELTPEQRPFECLQLVPNPASPGPEFCNGQGARRELLWAWAPYYSMLRRLYSELVEPGL